MSQFEQTVQIKQQLLKYKKRKFAITYSKKISQNARGSQCELENKLKELESNLNSGQILMNMQNLNRTLNLLMREQQRVLKLQANVIRMKKVKSQSNFSLISKKGCSKKIRSKLKRNL